MVNMNIIGTSFEITWQVERGKIAEFVAAIGDQNPVYSQANKTATEGHATVVAPPTFSTVPIMWSGILWKALEELDLPIFKLMHAEQQYEYYRAICAGDDLSAVMTVKSVTRKEGKSGPLLYVLFHTAFRNQDGQDVLKEEMLIVARP